VLAVFPEHARSDPFGEIVAADRGAGDRPEARMVIPAMRGAYASCQLVVALPASGDYRLEVGNSAPAGLEVSLFREWFHYLPAEEQYYPDALIPASLPYSGSLPDKANRIPKQTAQPFWLDIWVPAQAAPGDYTLTAQLRWGRKSESLPIRIRVGHAIVPDNDAILIDHNSYGTSWFQAQYPRLIEKGGSQFFESDAFFGLIQAYHRIFFEHRGIYHQLGYGHAGKVGPEFAPALAGSGANKHIVDWTLYDRHYGPLFDGSAFANTRRGAKPIPFVYLPINPEWPAAYEWWCEPGYEREFVNVVGEMERHFREKSWTSVRFEMFFNHKKRYKGFEWDGDEARFPKDYAYFREYARLLKEAVPAGSPIQFVFRSDVSWTMERQWKELAGVINFWVCGGGMFGWYPYAPDMLRKRGDIVWTYGGTPAVTEASSHISLEVLRAWMQGVGGFVRWETTSPGPDPWFHFAGGGENLVYPGDRFGIDEPIPSIRLKLERNTVQDVSLLDEMARRGNAEDLRRGVAKAFNNTLPADWWTARPALADTDPQDWSNADIDAATHPSAQFNTGLDAAAWQRARAYVYQAVEGKH